MKHQHDLRVIHHLVLHGAAADIQPIGEVDTELLFD